MAACAGYITVTPGLGKEGFEVVEILVREVNIQLVVAIGSFPFWSASLILLGGFFIFR